MTAAPQDGTALAALAGDGTRARLPAGAEPLDEPPRIRALPGATAPLLGLAVAEGGAVLPVLLAPGVSAPPGTWLRLPPPADAILGVAALVPAEPGDPDLPSAWLEPGAPGPLPAPAAPARAGARTAATPRAAREAPAAIRAATGTSGFDIPLGALRRILPAGAAACLQPVPGGLPGALGHLATELGPALLLDPRKLPGESGGARREGALVVLFEHAGALLALPADRVGPGDAARAAAFLAALPAAAPLSAAPRPLSASAQAARAGRAVLVAEAGGARFALAAAEVAALLPPGAAAPPPPGAPRRVIGLRAHRGEVLPVLDAAEAFATARSGALPLAERPLLRLATAAPVALALDALPALHRLPEESFAPSLGGAAGLVAAIATLGGAPLPLCHAEAFAAHALYSLALAPAA